MNYKVESVFTYKGMKCVVVGLSRGHRCGYVKIDNPTKEMIEAPYELDYKVHGGIAYGEYNKEYPIKIKKEAYWLGFDCAHYGDAIDGTLIRELNNEEIVPLMLIDMSSISDTVKDTNYVKDELIHLVNQIKKRR